MAMFNSYVKFPEGTHVLMDLNRDEWEFNRIWWDLMGIDKSLVGLNERS